MRRSKLNNVKLRRLWEKNPATQIHESKKRRKQLERETVQRAVDEALAELDAGEERPMFDC